MLKISLRNFPKKRTKWISVLTYSTYPLMFLFPYNLWMFTKLHCNHNWNLRFIPRIKLLFHSLSQDESDYESRERAGNTVVVAFIKHMLSQTEKLEEMVHGTVHFTGSYSVKLYNLQTKKKKKKRKPLNIWSVTICPKWLYSERVSTAALNSSIHYLHCKSHYFHPFIFLHSCI